MENTIKKISIMGSFAFLLGSTIMGASAYTLADYPQPFVKDGQFDAAIVVGDRAAAEDVIGAVDIGASLQYALAQPIEANNPLLIQGDVVEIGEASDLLEIGERIGDVRETITDAFLDALRSGIITTDEGTTDYNQFIRFENNANSEWVSPTQNTIQNYGDIPSGKVVFDEDEDDVVGHYLYFQDGDTIFEYEIEFEEGVESEIRQKSTGIQKELDDLEDEQIVILGETYTIVDTLIDTTNQKVKLELIGGDVVDTLEEGECKNYVIDDVDYEVCVLIVSDNKNNNEGTVKFSVNGEITDELDDGDVEMLRDGTQIGVRDILPNEAEEVSGGDIVEFFMGANEIEFEDKYSDTKYNQGGVEVGNEDIEDAELLIRAVNITESSFELTSIKYRLRADALKGDIYIRPGHGLREFLDEPQGMLNTNWDILYNGLQDTGVSIIKFDASGDDSYTLSFTSREGIDYVIPLVDNSNDDGEGFKYGDEDDELYFKECVANPITTATENITTWCIKEDDIFVLTDDNDETGLTHVLTYESIDTTNNELTFTDLGTGQREITFDISAGATYPGQLGVGELVVGGNTFFVFVGNASNGFNLAIDLTANGAVAAEYANIVVDGGGILDLGDQCTSQQSPYSGRPSNITACSIESSLKVGLITPSSEFDEAGPFNLPVNENITINITTRSGNELDLDVKNSFACIDASGDFNISESAGCPSGESQHNVLKMQSLQDEDIRQGLSSYGVFFEQSGENNNNEADELIVEYPLFQRGVVVYVSAENKIQKQSEQQLVTLNQINVGSAKLASEVQGQEFSQNMIVVGGPCINSAAAKLMGSDEPLCGIKSEIQPGTAVVKLFENEGYVSLLVAGYDKQDTRKATKVIADYQNYQDELEGTGVIVSGSLSNLNISVPK